MEQICIECGEVYTSPKSGDPPVCEDCLPSYNKCDYCAEWFKENGTPYCDDCLPEFTQCKECDTWFDRDDIHLVYNEFYCDNCFHKFYTTCDLCDKTIDINDAIYTISDEVICDLCYHNNYFCCESCGNIISNDYYGRGDLCQECADEYNEFLHSYEYKPIPNFHGTTNPYYGIELETDDYDGNGDYTAEKLINLDRTERDFYLKEDSSLSNGIEIVFHPRNFQSWKDYDLEKILKTVRDNGGKSFNTDTCGLHIHRSNRDLSDITKVKLIMFFGHCSKQIITLAQRRSSYARFVLFEESSDKNICYKVIKKEGHSTNRSQAINFMNQDTIEFRIFKGTLKLSTIMAYLAFCHQIVEFCKTTLLHDFIDGTKLWDKFINYLFSIKGNNTAIINLCSYLTEKKLI